MNDQHDIIVEAMMDQLPYNFETIEEWNNFRDALFALIEALDQTKLTRANIRQQ